MSVTDFGAAGDRAVQKVTFESPRGNFRASIITFGATIQSFQMRDPATSQWVELTLGWDDVESYATLPGHLGATVGRYANRIGNATFPREIVESDAPVVLPANNNNKHTLHGGPGGFSRRVWDSFELVTDPATGKCVGVALSIHSPAGDQGFPGDFDATAVYSFDAQEGFVIDLRGRVENAPTVCSLTNHAYWNLSGYAASPSSVTTAGGATDESQQTLPTVMNHVLHIPNGRFYVATDAFSIPTGEIRSTKGTPLDFTTAKALESGADDALINPGAPAKGGYDNCIVLAGGPPGVMRHAATLTDPASGRTMTVTTTLPGVQVYSGNYLEDRVGHGGARFGYRCGLCLETQLFPDTPNYTQFPTAVLRPGETWRHVTVHRFGSAVAAA